MAFTDGLCALCGGEPAWRLVLGEWTCKCISLFITAAIVSRFPDGFADGLFGGEPLRRFVLGEWVNMQMYFSIHFCSYCVPISWWLCWPAVLWRTTKGICSWLVIEWTCKSISLFITVAIVSRCPDGFYWRVGRSVRWRTSVETCSRWVNMQTYFSIHYCSYCVPISWWLCWPAVLWRTTYGICSRWVSEHANLFLFSLL